MRVAIVKGNGYLDGRISRILVNNGIKGDVVSKITRSSLNEFDTLIFTYQNQIPNLPKLLEQIVLEKRIQVLYITNTPSIGQFYNLFDDVFFNYVMEVNIDVMIPKIIEISRKYLRKIKYLEETSRDAKESVSVLKNTNKAKRILMNKGLSEDDSHRFIIDKAMTLRMSKKAIVNLIIENKIDI